MHASTHTLNSLLLKMANPPHHLGRRWYNVIAEAHTMPGCLQHLPPLLISPAWLAACLQVQILHSLVHGCPLLSGLLHLRALAAAHLDTHHCGQLLLCPPVVWQQPA